MNYKTKLIEKDRKITRSQKRKIKLLKQQSSSQQIKRRNPSTFGKTVPNFYKGQLMIKQNDLQSQNIVINLNLGQYGFDGNSLKNSQYQRLKQTILNAQLLINTNLQNQELKKIFQDIRQVLKAQNFLISNKKVFILCNNLKLTQVSENQFKFWNLLNQLFTQIKQDRKNPGGLIELIVLHVEKAKQIISKCENNLVQLQYIKNWDQIKVYEKQLNYQLINKTYNNGLHNLNINYLNYFLQQEVIQNSRNLKNTQNQKIIKNWQQWCQFIKKKRVRLRKANKFLLHTACQLCLSSYYQLSNPLINCPECHARGHKLCFNLTNSTRCGRCIYLRLSNQIRQKVPQCIFCNVKNLVPLKLNGNIFVHVFCVISHGLLKQINLNNFQQKIQTIKKKKKTCFFCQNQSKFYTNCKCCQNELHYLCAFFQGAHFEATNQEIIVKCCELDSNEMRKLRQERKYILNYDNLVFKKLAQIQSSFKQKKKKYSQLQQINFQS